MVTIMKHSYGKNTRTLCSFLCVMLIVISLPSCGYSIYLGDRVDLYTVAVNNVFGALGYTSNGEACYDPEISVIETDDYGRTLFFYSESYGGGDFEMAFLIMQSSDDKNVYYYQDDCCFVFTDDSDRFWHGRRGGEDYIEAVKLASNEIEELKSRNDWGRELDPDKCTKSEISAEKPEGEIDVKTWTFDEKIYEYAKANGYMGSDESQCSFFVYCNGDGKGRELYYVPCMTADDYGDGKTTYDYYTYAVIVNTEGLLFKTTNVADGAVAEIKDPADTYEIIKKLKAENGWGE